MLGSYRPTAQGDLFAASQKMAGTLQVRGAAVARDLGERMEQLRREWAGFVRQYGYGRVEVCYWAGRARPDFRVFECCEEFAQFTAAVEGAGFRVALRCA
jgi:hypothetical protein